MIDIKAVQAEAQKELNEERMKKAKDKIKGKMRDISVAEQIVTNLRRELEDLYADIARQSL